MDRMAEIPVGSQEAAADQRLRLRISVAGIVQGVGFRPFVYRLACRERLSGYILNNPQGVGIEVEGALKSHDGVFDAVVVGVPDQRWGERVVAVVQGRDGARPAFEALDTHVRTHIAGYKAPRDVVFVDAIVRSPSGKPDYRWAKTVATQHVLPHDPDAVPAP